MENYGVFANAPVLKWAAAGVVLFVMVQSGLFMLVAYRRGKAAGIPRDVMNKALRTGMTNSIIPSLPIVIALIAISPVIGVPISWMRLSVIGSAPYELMAAGIGAKTMGVDSLGGSGFTAGVFANAVWIMCIGSFWAIMLVSAFYKGIKKRYALKAGTDNRWNEILTAACFMGVFSLFMADPMTTGGTSLVTFLVAAASMLLCLLMVVRFKLERLKEFALTISMIVGMAGSVAWTKIIGM